MKATASDLRMKGQGIGSVHQFVCARWRGMKTYICAECATAVAADGKRT